MFLPLSWVRAGIGLEFEHSQYGVQATGGGEIEVRVMIDGDDQVPGRQSVPDGLFSYGFVVRFDQAHWQLAPGNAVVIDPALNFFGFSPGASISAGGGFLAMKGNVSPLGSPWSGNLLATLRLQPKGTPPPSGSLTLEIFEQSPNESVFLNGLGIDIDPLIVPRPSLIVRLDPPRLEFVAGVTPHTRLSYHVPPGADVAIEWSRSMTVGEWQDLPGAPHNSGEYLDFTSADRRFYRLTLMNR